jgi:hypothetical protein
MKVVSKLDEILKLLKSGGMNYGYALEKDFAGSSIFPIASIQKLMELERKLREDKNFKKEVVNTSIDF